MAETLDEICLRARLEEAIVAHFARQADLSPRRLNAILDGETRVSSAELAIIAHVANVSTHWLLTGRPDPLAPRVIACQGIEDAP